MIFIADRLITCSAATPRPTRKIRYPHRAEQQPPSWTSSEVSRRLPRLAVQARRSALQRRQHLRPHQPGHADHRGDDGENRREDRKKPVDRRHRRPVVPHRSMLLRIDRSGTGPAWIGTRTGPAQLLDRGPAGAGGRSASIDDLVCRSRRAVRSRRRPREGQFPAHWPAPERRATVPGALPPPSRPGAATLRDRSHADAHCSCCWVPARDDQLRCSVGRPFSMTNDARGFHPPRGPGRRTAF